jgi:hypothetical protein
MPAGPHMRGEPMKYGSKTVAKWSLIFAGGRFLSSAWDSCIPARMRPGALAEFPQASLRMGAAARPPASLRAHGRASCWLAFKSSLNGRLPLTLRNNRCTGCPNGFSTSVRSEVW